jgi:hypothetical protein
MYVYVRRKIDRMMTITSQRGKINLRQEGKKGGNVSSGFGPEFFLEE